MHHQFSIKLPGAVWRRSKTECAVKHVWFVSNAAMIVSAGHHRTDMVYGTIVVTIVCNRTAINQRCSAKCHRMSGTVNGRHRTRRVGAYRCRANSRNAFSEVKSVSSSGGSVVGHHHGGPIGYDNGRIIARRVVFPVRLEADTHGVRPVRAMFCKATKRRIPSVQPSHGAQVPEMGGLQCNVDIAVGNNTGSPSQKE